MANPNRICSVDECGNKKVARGVCGKHYQRLKASGKIQAAPRENASNKGADCAVSDCSTPARKRGFCEAHYERWRRSGDPLGADGTPRGSIPDFISRLVSEEISSDVCITWPYHRAHNGYGTLSKRDGRTPWAHRRVCEDAHGAPPAADYQAAHSCGNGKLGCVNPKHLRWATASDNQADKVDHGTDNRGEKHYRALLTESDVRMIRAANASVSNSQIAGSLGVSSSTVRSARTRKSWAWLK